MTAKPNKLESMEYTGSFNNSNGHLGGVQLTYFANTATILSVK